MLCIIVIILYYCDARIMCVGAGRGVGLPAIFIHVRFSVCPRGWPGTLRGFKGLLSVAWSLPQHLDYCDEHTMLLIHNYNFHIF